MLLALIYILWCKCRPRRSARCRIDLLQSSSPEDEKYLPRNTILSAQYLRDPTIIPSGIVTSASSLVASSYLPTPEASLISSGWNSRMDCPLPPLPPPLHTRAASEASESAMLSSRSSSANAGSSVTMSRVAVSASGAGSGKSSTAPSSSKRVLVVQHQDAGPSELEAEPDVTETIELPPAYSELRPVAPSRKFVASPLAAFPVQGSRATRSRRPVTYTW